MPLLSIVIPAYNEEATIEGLLARVEALPLDKEVLIVDDGSTDGTRAILDRYVERPGLRVFYQPKNRGKGAAIRRGFIEARGDIVVVQDADLEYDPSELPRLIAPIVDGRADVVYGARFLPGERRVNQLFHTVGNRGLTLFSNLLSGLDLNDMETCYKAFRREVIQGLYLESERFGIEPEMTAKIAKLVRGRRLRLFEMPISYEPRWYDEGKKIGWKDGVQAVWSIMKFNLLTSDEASFRDDLVI